MDQPQGGCVIVNDLPRWEITVSQSLTAIYVHIVFSTKDREPFLSDPAVRAGLHAQLGEISNRLGCPAIVTGGIDDHIHQLGHLGRTVSPADWVKELKRVSNLWLKEQGDQFKSFEWQRGYAGFSVSQSNVDQVKDYILNQEEHHRKQSFQDELRALLRKHNLAWDERYLWD